MINVHFPSLNLKDSGAVDLGISLIAVIVNMKLGTITDPKVCYYFQNSGESIKKCQKNGISSESVTPSRSNSSDDQPSACQWWFFIHHETSAGSTLWSPGQQLWQLSPQSTGSSFRLLWAWPCPAIEANIAHQTKQFMTRSNFDLGPPEMPLPSENEKI